MFDDAAADFDEAILAPTDAEIRLHSIATHV